MAIQAMVGRTHKIVGLVMLLPLLTWAITGTVFLFKPGYDTAYERLTIPAAVIDAPIQLPAGLGPQVYVHNTRLGRLVLVGDGEQWRLLNETTASLETGMSTALVKQLLQTAIAQNPVRYGSIDRVEGLSATTSTGVDLSLQLPLLTVRQSAADTRFINQLYRWHYLQWTGHAGFDRFLGGLGLVLLVILSGMGVWWCVCQQNRRKALPKCANDGDVPPLYRHRHGRSERQFVY